MDDVAFGLSRLAVNPGSHFVLQLLVEMFEVRCDEVQFGIGTVFQIQVLETSEGAIRNRTK